MVEDNKIIIINTAGKTIGMITNSVYNFTFICNCLDYFYISTAESVVLVYSLRTFSIIKEVPATHTSSIKSLKVSTNSLEYLIYEDATIQIINLTNLQVINQYSGHSFGINYAI